MNPTPEPLLLNFETDTRCNARCSFCMHSRMKRGGRASWSQLLDVMYWHVPDAQVVNPFGIQEPTLEPRLTAILANCKMFNRHAKTDVYTNMAHYDEETWRRIIRCNLLDGLDISFYGVSKRAYNMLQPPLDYEQTRRNIKRLMRLRRRMRWRRPIVKINLIITPETLPHAEKFKREWSGVVDAVGFKHFDAWCGLNKYDLSFQQRVWGKPLDKRPPCQRLWSALVVHCDGSVVPCCLDYDNSMVMGNIHEDHNVFTGARFQELRQMHVDGRQDELDLCRDCSLWLYEMSEEWVKYWEQGKPVISAVNP